PEHPPVTGSLEQIVGNQVRGLKEIARTHELGRDPVAGAGLEHDQSVEHQQARALPRDREPWTRIALTDSELDELRGGELPSGDATAEVQLLGEPVVGVQDIREQRTRPRWTWPGAGPSRPLQRPMLGAPSVRASHADCLLIAQPQLAVYGSQPPLGRRCHPLPGPVVTRVTRVRPQARPVVRKAMCAWPFLVKSSRSSMTLTDSPRWMWPGSDGTSA